MSPSLSTRKVSGIEQKKSNLNHDNRSQSQLFNLGIFNRSLIARLVDFLVACCFVGRDFVTGFHKRKKKRRKEAEKQQDEAMRRKRIEARKKVRNDETVASVFLYSDSFRCTFDLTANVTCL